MLYSFCRNVIIFKVQCGESLYKEYEYEKYENTIRNTILVCNASARYSAPRAIITLLLRSSVIRVCMENGNRHQQYEEEEELLYCFLTY